LSSHRNRYCCRTSRNDGPSRRKLGCSSGMAQSARQDHCLSWDLSPRLSSSRWVRSVNSSVTNCQKTPPRTVPPQFIARVVMAGLGGACLYMLARSSALIGALRGAVGAVIGTLGGYQARKGLVKALKVKDIFVAIPEDLIAIGLAYFIVR